jgi:hypothetical protein
MEMDTDAVDSKDGQGVPELGIAPDAADNAADVALQERMAGNADQQPWYSPSEGKVVTPNGDVVLDPKTGKPYLSMEAYQAAQKAQSSTAKPKTDAQGKPVQTPPAKPMSRSFDALVTQDGKLTPERLFELSKVASDFQYADDLIPKVDPSLAAKEAEKPTDALTAVHEHRTALEERLVRPLQEIRDWLIQNGGNVQAVDEFMGPKIAAQNALIDKDYREQYERALKEDITKGISPEITEFKRNQVKQASETNINRIASKLYGPENAKEAFFTLINGHYGADGKFIRGPAANVIDMLMHVASNGKGYATPEARSAAYEEQFTRMMADPKVAAVVFDVAHHYWLGKQQYAAQRMSYEKGKVTAQRAMQVAKKTVRTPPASYGTPVTDTEGGIPEMLRTLGVR